MPPLVLCALLKAVLAWPLVLFSTLKIHFSEKVYRFPYKDIFHPYLHTSTDVRDVTSTAMMSNDKRVLIRKLQNSILFGNVSKARLGERAASITYGWWIGHDMLVM